jgi:capsule polysaccharide export protein KpsE/RkpR
LILRVLKVSGDYSLSYEKIVKICFDNAVLVNALNTRFKKQKKANTVVRLTLEEFENFINNYSHKDPRTSINLIVDINQRLNIANPVEQTKGTTVVTSAQEI